MSYGRVRCGCCGRLVRSIGEGDESGLCSICSPLPKIHKVVGQPFENPAITQEKKLKKASKKKAKKKTAKK